jgi:hypothetical protein
MTSVRLLLVGAIMILASTVCISQPSVPRNPFVGTWTLSLTGITCRETIEFRADGTAHTVSAGEDSLSRYAMVEIPKHDGSYVWFDTVLKNNGKPDCLGNSAPVSDKAINYLLPTSSGGFMLCSKWNGEGCVGVMSRTAARDL